ncbi:MAG: response regulator transcription factor [Pseudomonadota bacterium]
MTSATVYSDNTLYAVGLVQIMKDRGWHTRVRRLADACAPKLRSVIKSDLLVIVLDRNTRMSEKLGPVLDLHPNTPAVYVVEDEGVLADVQPHPAHLGAVIDPSHDADRIGTILELVLEGISVIPKALSASRPMPDQMTDQRIKTVASLTRREKEVLAVLSEGQTNKEIARTLAISSNTVEAHVSAIIRKMNVRNRTEAAMYGATLVSAPLGMAQDPARVTS